MLVIQGGQTLEYFLAVEFSLIARPGFRLSSQIDPQKFEDQTESLILCFKVQKKMCLFLGCTQTFSYIFPKFIHAYLVLSTTTLDMNFVFLHEAHQSVS